MFQLTDDFKRKLRPLNEIKFFKANEIKVWLLYVGPIVLRGLISPALYERLHLLSYFTRLLLSSNIFVNEADKLIKKFLNQMEEICGPNVFSPNVHSLNHLSWQVKNYGPLWCTSAIMFESANYLLKTKFTGTVNHLRLIVERYNRNKKIRREMPANDALFGFCQKFRKERETMQPSLRVPTVLSTCKMEKTFFDSLRVKNFNIHSFQKNEHNACISFIRDGTAVYGLVEQFHSARDVNYAIVSTFKILKTEKPEDVSLNILSYIEVELSGKQSECTASQISGKMVKILYNSKTFLTPLLDVFEHD